MTGFCFRCEYRAQFLEGRGRPRYECGDIENTKVGCYMFRPVMPVVQEKEPGDPRDIFAGWMVSARSRCLGVADVELWSQVEGEGVILCWVPKAKEGCWYEKARIS